MAKICQTCGQWDPCKCPIPTKMKTVVPKQKKKESANANIASKQKVETATHKEGIVSKDGGTPRTGKSKLNGPSES